MVVLVVDDAELSRCHPVDLFLCMDHEGAIVQRLHGSLQEFRCMTDFEIN